VFSETNVKRIEAVSKEKRKVNKEIQQTPDSKIDKYSLCEEYDANILD